MGDMSIVFMPHVWYINAFGVYYTKLMGYETPLYGIVWMRKRQYLCTRNSKYIKTEHKK